MDQKQILKEINKNKWLNGYFDMVDGDVLAMVTDKEYLDYIIIKKDIKKLFSSLKNYTGIYQYKNIIFANHWNYGCFVYAITKEGLKEFEHLTISAYTEEKFKSDIEEWVYKYN